MSKRTKTRLDNINCYDDLIGYIVECSFDGETRGKILGRSGNSFSVIDFDGVLSNCPINHCRVDLDSNPDKSLDTPPLVKALL